MNKGASDGIQSDQGVITPAGVVGRIVKTTASTAVVLLLTDPNNAIAGLIQRTRDEGIVEGTTQGQSRLKYIPLLSNARPGDHVVTSGLVGGFPRGIPIGTIIRIDKEEEALFQSAELSPEVDPNRVEEVLVIRPSAGSYRRGATWRSEAQAMKALIYLAVIVGLVPMQSVLLPHLTLWGVKPDLGLVAVCLIGLLGGELDGVLVGLALGWAMSLFSAQDLVSGAIMKGAVGFLAGLAGRQVVYLSPILLVMGLLVLSCLAGLVTPVALKLSDQQDLWWAVVDGRVAASLP